MGFFTVWLHMDLFEEWIFVHNHAVCKEGKFISFYMFSPCIKKKRKKKGRAEENYSILYRIYI